MSSIEERATKLLNETNALGNYHTSLICTSEGLLIAASGDEVTTEQVAGFTSLFDDIIDRAARDIGINNLEEVTLLEPRKGRFVIRPLEISAGERFFLVIQMPTTVTWRRNTHRLVTALKSIFSEAAWAA